MILLRWLAYRRALARNLPVPDDGEPLSPGQTWDLRDIEREWKQQAPAERAYDHRRQT